MSQLTDIPLSWLERETRAALGERGSLRVSTCWMSHGDATVLTALAPADALAMARALSNFHAQDAMRLPSGGTVVRGYLCATAST